MSVVRCFVAIELPKSLHQGLQKVSSTLQNLLEGSPIRWVEVNKVHITIKFLGDVAEKNIPVISELIQAETKKHKVFDISVGGFGAFPSLSKPRVLWVGIESGKDFHRLQRRIDGEISRLGYPADNRTFDPHLTLGRISRNVRKNELHQIKAVVSGYRIGFIGAARITEVGLFKSVLKPGGAVYTKMFSAPIGEQ